MLIYYFNLATMIIEKEYKKLVILCTVHISYCLTCFRHNSLRYFLKIVLVVSSYRSNHLNLRSKEFCDNCSGGNHCIQHWCLPCNLIFSQKNLSSSRVTRGLLDLKFLILRVSA